MVNGNFLGGFGQGLTNSLQFVSNLQNQRTQNDLARQRLDLGRQQLAQSQDLGQQRIDLGNRQLDVTSREGVTKLMMDRMKLTGDALKAFAQNPQAAAQSKAILPMLVNNFANYYASSAVGMTPGMEKDPNFVQHVKEEGQAIAQALASGKAPPEQPSAVREFEYYQKLSPSQKAQYLTVKRSQTFLNLGNAFVAPNQANPTQPAAVFQKGTAPENKVDTQNGRVISVPGSAPSGQLNGVPNATPTAAPAPVAAAPAANQMPTNDLLSAPATDMSAAIPAASSAPAATTVPAQAPAPPPAPAAGPTTQNLPPTQAQVKSRDNLSEALGRMANGYLSLDKMGAIVNPDRGGFENLSASIRSSDLGQTAEGAVGTQAQTIRQTIKNMQPLLINNIRQATGMSARAMDSNLELKFYLSAASDPHRDLYSNLAALDLLDKTYGNGRAVQDMLPPELYQKVQEKAGIIQSEAGLSGKPKGTVKGTTPAEAASKVPPPPAGFVVQ